MNKKKLIILIILLFILIGGLIGFYLYKKNVNIYSIDPNAKDYTQNIKEPNDFDENKTLIPGFGNISVPYNYEDEGMKLPNPKDNTVYFKYIIILDGTNQVLAETKLIPPGKAVEVYPWKGIKAGNYTLTIKIKAYSLDNTNTELNGADSKIKMNILN